MCVYSFLGLNLLQFKLQLQKKNKQWTGLVLLKYALDYLYKFLQEYDIFKQ